MGLSELMEQLEMELVQVQHESVMEEEKKEGNKAEVRGKKIKVNDHASGQSSHALIAHCFALLVARQPHLALVTDDPCQLRTGRVVVSSYLPLLWGAV
jgi:hypothetical protein